MEDYLQKILRARVYDVAEETPLERAKNLSKKFKNDIWFKREDLQPVFSFKLRGAFNRMSQLTKEEVDSVKIIFVLPPENIVLRDVLAMFFERVGTYFCEIL